jgi:hypothetical protein
MWPCLAQISARGQGDSVMKAIAGAALCAVLLVTGLPAQPASANLAKARMLMDAGHAQGAYALLSPELTANAGAPEFNYAFGLAASDSGHPADAAAAFERVLALQPNNLQARAELGRVYRPERAGSGAARTEYREKPNRRAGRCAQDTRPLCLGAGYRPVGRRHPRQRQCDGARRLDSNVNNSTSDTRILTPAFASLGFANLSPSAQAQQDGFGEALACLAGAGFLRRSAFHRRPRLPSSFDSEMQTPGGKMKQRPSD